MKNYEYEYHNFAGCFPRSKRNFIKENVKSIKQMQGLLQESGVYQPRAPRDDKFRNVPSIRSRDSTPHVNRAPSQEKIRGNRNVKKPIANVAKPKLDRKKERTDVVGQRDQKFTHRAMQTERTDDMTKLYETGVIKYPRPGVGKSRITPRISPQRAKGQGDAPRAEAIDESMQQLDIDEKDFVKENMQNFKPKAVKQLAPKVPAQAPPTYQRGVVPKYLRDRKEEDKEGEEDPCPDGHVLLPEEERKETLRVLRQSYADRIQELNSLPVRSDTLRVKKRKTEIEEELKRIDGGIKVFQRPKVYVKINA